jgi:hypothetical protein
MLTNSMLSLHMVPLMSVINIIVIYQIIKSCMTAITHIGDNIKILRITVITETNQKILLSATLYIVIYDLH